MAEESEKTVHQELSDYVNENNELINLLARIETINDLRCFGNQFTDKVNKLVF